MASAMLVVPIIAIVATAAVLTRTLKRGSKAAATSGSSTNGDSFARVEERIARLEQAVDVIAVEMERIGESQRYLTRVLAERPTPTSSTSRT
jgi:hypothetical protein